MSSLISIIVAAALVNNLALVQLLGVSSLFAFSNRLRAAVELALLSFPLLFLASFINLLWFRFVLQPLGLEFLQLLCTVLVAAALTGAMALLLRPRLPLTLRRHDLAFYLAGTNSAVIGLSLQNAVSLYTPLEAGAYSLGAAAGFALLLPAFAALRQRLEQSDLPAPFRGAPAYLLSAGIVAMSLLGFAGLV